MYVVWAALVVVPVAHGHIGHKAVSVEGIAVETGALVISPTAKASLGFETMPAVVRPVEDMVVVVARAQVPPQRQVVQTSPVAGRLTGLKFRVGEEVRKGQRLFDVESLEVQSASVDLFEAGREEAVVAQQVARLRRLSGPGAVAQRELKETETRLVELRAKRRGQRARLRAIGVEARAIDALERTGELIVRVQVVSPIDGVLTDLPATRGQVLKTESPLFAVQDLSRVLVEGQLTASDLGRVREGQDVRVRFPSVPQRVYRGRVQVMGAAVEHETSTLGVYAEVDNPDGQIRAGMYGEMEIVVGRRPKAVVVPREAVLRAGAESFVLVEEGGRVVYRPVVLGTVHAGLREIVEGVKGGEMAVTKGGHELSGFFWPGELELSSQAQRNSGLRVEGVEMGPLDVVIGFPASLAVPSAARAFGSSRVAGWIERVLVRPGARVRAGETLALVTSRDLPEIAAQMEATRARLELVKRQIERTRRLGVGVLTPAKHLLKLQAEERVEETRLEGLARRLALLGITPEEITRSEAVAALPIVAPATGVLVHQDLAAGTFVEPDRHVLEVADVSVLWAEGDLPEEKAGLVRPGQGARLRLSAFAGRILEGQVAFLEPTIDRGHRAVHVVVELANDGSLRPGLSGTLTVVVGETSDTIRVPREAVLREAGETFCFVAEGRRFIRSRVRLGRQEDRFVEVLTGVYPGERVATGGVEALRVQAMSLR